MHVPDFSSLAPAFAGPINIGGRWWIVHEADPDTADKYRAAGLRGVEMAVNDNDDTRTLKKLEHIHKVEPILNTNCTFEVEGETGKLRLDSDGNPDKKYLVPADVYKRWPSRVRRWLYDTIKDISDLDEKDTVENLEKQIARLQRRLEKVRAENPT